jgi:hypothetical protein
MDLGVADHRQRASRGQAAQIAIALFADITKLLLTSARMLLRYETDPGCEVPGPPECLGMGDAGNQGGGQGRTDPGDLVEPPARFIGSVSSHDPTVKLQNLVFQHP